MNDPDDGGFFWSTRSPVPEKRWHPTHSTAVSDIPFAVIERVGPIAGAPLRSNNRGGDVRHGDGGSGFRGNADVGHARPMRDLLAR